MTSTHLLKKFPNIFKKKRYEGVKTHFHVTFSWNISHRITFMQPFWFSVNWKLVLTLKTVIVQNIVKTGYANVYYKKNFITIHEFNYQQVRK